MSRRFSPTATTTSSPGYNFHRGFRVWRWIRGQEYDPWRSGPLSKLRLEDHIKESYDPTWRRLVEACLKNTEHFETADDHYCARLVADAIEWLEANRDHDHIFCWVDSFDPHEPGRPRRSSTVIPISTGRGRDSSSLPAAGRGITSMRPRSPTFAASRRARSLTLTTTSESSSMPWSGWATSKTQ